MGAEHTFWLAGKIKHKCDPVSPSNQQQKCSEIAAVAGKDGEDRGRKESEHREDDTAEKQSTKKRRTERPDHRAIGEAVAEEIRQGEEGQARESANTGGSSESGLRGQGQGQHRISTSSSSDPVGMSPTEDAVEDETSEEVRKIRQIRKPNEPTAQERLEHDRVHLPFRSWCEICVKGRGKEPHYKHEDADRAMFSVVIDFFFIADGKGETKWPCVVMRERETKYVHAYMMPTKSTDDDAVVRRLMEDIQEMGLDKETVVIKGDQEPSITPFIRKLQEACGRGIEERSRKYRSQSNGVAERAVQSIEQMVKVMLLALQKRLNATISGNHPIVSWMVIRAAQMLNTLEVGHDGRTAYERLKGKPY